MTGHRQGYLCRVTRLPLSATTEHVKANFSHFGKILDAMVVMDHFHDESTGVAYIVFEEESARSALMKRSGTLFCGHIIGVTDDKYGFGRNAYEEHESLFDACITIGEDRNRGPKDSVEGRPEVVVGASGGPGPYRRIIPGTYHGMVHAQECNTDAGRLEGSA